MLLLRLAITALALLVPITASAQGATWPAKPIRWVIPYPPAGITDSATRMVLQKVMEQTGWSIVVDNKPGANSILGADLAPRSARHGVRCQGRMYAVLTTVKNSRA